MNIIRVRPKTPTSVLERAGFKKKTGSEGENERYVYKSLVIFVKNNFSSNFQVVNVKRKEMGMNELHQGVVYFERKGQEESLFYKKYLEVSDLEDLPPESIHFFEKITIEKDINLLKRYLSEKVEKDFNTIPIKQGNSIYFSTNESFEIKMKENGNMTFIIEKSQEEIPFKHFSVNGTKLYLYNSPTSYKTEKVLDI